MRAAIWLMLAAVVVARGTASAQQMQHFRMEKITDRVYAFIGSDPTLDWVDGNSYAIIGDDGVFVVDSHQPPIVAEANIAEIRKLTTKPIKYLLNTHWHGDHNTGNFVYKAAYPDILIISQIKTREILSRRMPEWVNEARNGQYAGYLKDYAGWMKEGKGPSGRALTDVDRDRMTKVMKLLELYDPDVRRDTAVIPNVTFDKRLTIFMGDEEIQIRHDCPANTPGDAYVWLPKEQILITGDIVVSPMPYCFGSFFDQWVTALDSMLALKPNVICPGHGEVMRDTTYMRTIRDLFASIWEQEEKAYKSGVMSADSLRKVIDVSSFRKTLAGDDPLKDWLFRAYMLYPTVSRILNQLSGQIGDDLEEN
ncbi:MAG: MBL fold metallo-hydrolase [Candidatus Zixiibacteriota bacterium]